MVAVILAAGASRRMGRSKPLLPLGRTTYLGWILTTLRAAETVPLVVVGAERDGVAAEAGRVDATATVVTNPRWRAGMLSSIQCAVKHLRGRRDVGALLLCPVDVPRFAAATVTALVAAHRLHAPALALPCFQGRHGHPALFGRRLWPELLATDIGASARTVVDAHRQEILEVAVTDPWILRDADTPAAHRRMQEGL